MPAPACRLLNQLAPSLLVSSTGMAGCLDAVNPEGKKFSVGYGYKWGDDHATKIEDTCDVGPWRVSGLAARSVHALTSVQAIAGARAVVRAGSVVGAGALVPEGREVPAKHMALGVPVTLRPMDGSVQGEWIDFGVQEYLRNAQRYRTGLRRIG